MHATRYIVYFFSIKDMLNVDTNEKFKVVVVDGVA